MKKTLAALLFILSLSAPVLVLALEASPATDTAAPQTQRGRSWCYNVQNSSKPQCFSDKATCTNNIQVDTNSVSACAPGSATTNGGTSDFNFKFHPIVSIPLPTGGSVGESTSLPCYLNAIFKIAITVAVVIAVIKIVIDGFKYMTSEAVGGKKDALGGLRSAVGGLILLLAAYLIINIINPQILTLKILNVDNTGLSGCIVSVKPQTSAPPSAVDRAKPVGDPLATPPTGTFGGSSIPWCYTSTKGGSQVCFMSSIEKCEKDRTTYDPKAAACALQKTPTPPKK